MEHPVTASLDWLVSHLTYDVITYLLVTLIVAISGTVIFGPVMRAVQGLSRIAAFAATLLVSGVILSFLIPRPNAPLPGLIIQTDSQVIVASPPPMMMSADAKTAVFLFVSIANTEDMQSIAQNFTLTGTVNDRDVYKSRLAPIPTQGLCMNQPSGGAKIIYGIDDLSNKALSPIQQGGQVT
jgi:hypothetical protein